ncbi:ring canal kelch homolog [Acyrthosiphon pisum]|uniref:BACK domain-containing protein n=1 Tax=Acyrthosiphon pisum TaxID=7029 RepID=A0A8R2JLJ5_ACYPI|nr:ring canal kelch homolog [Acyrthosiphon pisum]
MYREVVKGDDFLSLSSEEVVKFISSDELSVPSEEKVVECVIRWLKYDLDSRKCNLPKLMEHVRLPLASKNYINLKVVKEPLLNNCPECKKFIYEALQFHILKSNQPDRVITIPECIRYKPRLGDKVIFVVGGSGYRSSSAYRTEWYDPKTNGWNFGPEMTNPRYEAGLAVLYDHFVFFMGGYNSGKSHRSVVVLDLFSESPCWKPTVAMLVKRHALGVGVGGHDGTNQLNSAEKFDCTTKKWRMISSMSTTRFDLVVGVLNNLLYAVGGWDDSGEGLNFVECYHPSLIHGPQSQKCIGGYGGINHLLGDTLNSVECYHPNLDTWTPLAEMCKCRSGLGVGVLDGVLYAIGGYDERESLKSVEAYRPSTGAWTSIADMNFPRQSPGVVALDGLLYVIGGLDGDTHYDSVEFYNPISDTWNMLDARMNVARQSTSVVTIIRPPHF